MASGWTDEPDPGPGQPDAAADQRSVGGSDHGAGAAVAGAAAYDGDEPDDAASSLGASVHGLSAPLSVASDAAAATLPLRYRSKAARLQSQGAAWRAWSVKSKTVKPTAVRGAAPARGTAHGGAGTARAPAPARHYQSPYEAALARAPRHPAGDMAIEPESARATAPKPPAVARPSSAASAAARRPASAYAAKPPKPQSYERSVEEATRDVGLRRPRSAAIAPRREQRVSADEWDAYTHAAATNMRGDGFGGVAPHIPPFEHWPVVVMVEPRHAGGTATASSASASSSTAALGRAQRRHTAPQAVFAYAFGEGVTTGPQPHTTAWRHYNDHTARSVSRDRPLSARTPGAANRVHRSAPAIPPPQSTLRLHRTASAAATAARAVLSSTASSNSVGGDRPSRPSSAAATATLADSGVNGTRQSQAAMRSDRLAMRKRLAEHSQFLAGGHFQTLSFKQKLLGGSLMPATVTLDGGDDHGDGGGDDGASEHGAHSDGETKRADDRDGVVGGGGGDGGGAAGDDDQLELGDVIDDDDNLSRYNHPRNAAGSRASSRPTSAAAQQRRPSLPQSGGPSPALSAASVLPSRPMSALSFHAPPSATASSSRGATPSGAAVPAQPTGSAASSRPTSASVSRATNASAAAGGGARPTSSAASAAVPALFPFDANELPPPVLPTALPVPLPSAATNPSASASASASASTATVSDTRAHPQPSASAADADSAPFSLAAAQAATAAATAAAAEAASAASAAHPSIANLSVPYSLPQPSGSPALNRTAMPWAAATATLASAAAAGASPARAGGDPVGPWAASDVPLNKPAKQPPPPQQPLSARNSTAPNVVPAYTRPRPVPRPPLSVAAAHAPPTAAYASGSQSARASSSSSSSSSAAAAPAAAVTYVSHPDAASYFTSEVAQRFGHDRFAHDAVVTHAADGQPVLLAVVPYATTQLQLSGPDTVAAAARAATAQAAARARKNLQRRVLMLHARSDSDAVWDSVRAGVPLPARPLSATSRTDKLRFAAGATKTVPTAQYVPPTARNQMAEAVAAVGAGEGAGGADADADGAVAVEALRQVHFNAAPHNEDIFSSLRFKPDEAVVFKQMWTPATLIVKPT